MSRCVDFSTIKNSSFEDLLEFSMYMNQTGAGPYNAVNSAINPTSFTVCKDTSSSTDIKDVLKPLVSFFMDVINPTSSFPVQTEEPKVVPNSLEMKIGFLTLCQAIKDFNMEVSGTPFKEQALKSVNAVLKFNIEIVEILRPHKYMKFEPSNTVNVNVATILLSSTDVRLTEVLYSILPMFMNTLYKTDNRYEKFKSKPVGEQFLTDTIMHIKFANKIISIVRSGVYKNQGLKMFIEEKNVKKNEFDQIVNTLNNKIKPRNILDFDDLGQFTELVNAIRSCLRQSKLFRPSVSDKPLEFKVIEQIESCRGYDDYNHEYVLGEKKVYKVSKGNNTSIAKIKTWIKRFITDTVDPDILIIKRLEIQIPSTVKYGPPLYNLVIEKHHMRRYIKVSINYMQQWNTDIRLPNNNINLIETFFTQYKNIGHPHDVQSVYKELGSYIQEIVRDTTSFQSCFHLASRTGKLFFEIGKLVYDDNKVDKSILSSLYQPDDQNDFQNYKLLVVPGKTLELDTFSDIDKLFDSSKLETFMKFVKDLLKQLEYGQYMLIKYSFTLDNQNITLLFAHSEEGTFVEGSIIGTTQTMTMMIERHMSAIQSCLHPELFDVICKLYKLCDDANDLSYSGGRKSSYRSKPKKTHEKRVVHGRTYSIYKHRNKMFIKMNGKYIALSDQRRSS